MRKMSIISYIIVLAICFMQSANATMSKETYLKKKAALIVKYSQNDKTFETLHKAMKKEDTLSGEFWRWKIDQYLYGQYTEFQPIYDAYTKKQNIFRFI